MRASLIKTHLFSLLVFVLGFQLMGALMGYVTVKDIDMWYNTINRSPLTPPDSTFGIVWPILYLLLAFAAWRIFITKDAAFRTTILFVFVFHMIVNWAWNPVFFTLNLIFPAFLMILFLIFTAAMLLYLIWPTSRAAALCFLPYLMWLTFAGHLTQFIWLNN